MMIFIDGDSCPVIKNTIKIAKENNIETTIVKDYNHQLNIDYGNIVTVSQEPDAADIYILNNISKKDILVTNDIGLASIALSKKAKVIGFSGNIINNNNIDFLLFNRHINKLNRKNNIFNTRIKKRNKNDDLTFEKSLYKLISEA
ncbi:DUF188 domain-containing protein [Miniphocaeibacter halophilus]|uniref:DUF188 domain-containing protein n=1 Tax=Miniphocaeibacter halophilus TaxID=2931922 RepID=A0AC61MSE8_9FIRM|nr:DUF188 domain-containing protein [Miniphocaeibacter halophilus]QQK08560.1 DUF188 domain-containing protein [Miniphocaeibacter halophilus]